MIFVGPKAPKARTLEMSAAVVRHNGRAFSPKVCSPIKPSPLGWARKIAGPLARKTKILQLQNAQASEYFPAFTKSLARASGLYWLASRVRLICIFPNEIFKIALRVQLQNATGCE